MFLNQLSYIWNCVHPHTVFIFIWFLKFVLWGHIFCWNKLAQVCWLPFAPSQNLIRVQKFSRNIWNKERNRESLFLTSTALKPVFFLNFMWCLVVVLCCISYIFPTKLKGEKSNIHLFIKSDLVVKTPCLLWKNEEKKGD